MTLHGTSTFFATKKFLPYNKLTSRFIETNQADFRALIKLSQTNIFIKSKVDIDIGIDNLATVTFSDSKPFIVNGKPLKAINQYFNKINASLVGREKTAAKILFPTTNLQI